MEVKNVLAEMRDRAHQIRVDALNAFNKASAHCSKKIFNTDCMEKAKKVRTLANREAVGIEKGAANIEKSVRNETRTMKKASQAEKADVRQAASVKPVIQSQIKREKLLIKLEKLQPSTPPGGVTHE